MLTQQLPKIMCAICNKEVDEIRILHSMFMDRITFSVRCHGEIDNCEMDGLDLRFMKNLNDLSEGVAFTTKRLNEPQKQLTKD